MFHFCFNKNFHNPFHTAGYFLYPLKSSEKLCFFMYSEDVERSQ